VGELVLEFWANLKNDVGAYYYDILLGLIPASNVRAQRYIEHLGFDTVGEIPRICTMVYEDHQESGILYCLDLGRYRNGRG
jgi:predicted N-acyltransferase